MWQLVVEVVAIDMHMILVLGHIFHYPREVH